MDDAKKMSCPLHGKQSVAYAYVPWQYFDKSYDPQRALKVGTIFPELDKPFIGSKPGGMRV